MPTVPTPFPLVTLDNTTVTHRFDDALHVAAVAGGWRLSLALALKPPGLRAGQTVAATLITLEINRRLHVTYANLRRTDVCIARNLHFTEATRIMTDPASKRAPERESLIEAMRLARTIAQAESRRAPVSGVTLVNECMGFVNRWAGEFLAQHAQTIRHAGKISSPLWRAGDRQNLDTIGQVIGERLRAMRPYTNPKLNRARGLLGQYLRNQAQDIHLAKQEIIPSEHGVLCRLILRATDGSEQRFQATAPDPHLARNRAAQSALQSLVYQAEHDDIDCARARPRP